MERINTYTALGKSEGAWSVFIGIQGSREPLRNERATEEHPFVDFANARNLPELLGSLDAIYGTGRFDGVDFISDRGGTDAPCPVDAGDAEAIARLFESKPTKTTVAKTAEAIAAWSIEGAVCSERQWRCIPLADIVQARRDLNRTCLIMAWLLGKTDFDTAHGLTRGDKGSRVETIDLESRTDLGDYYRGLASSPGNAFDSISIRLAGRQIARLNLYDPKSIERTAAAYTRCTFNLLLSDTHRRMGELLDNATSSNTVLSAIWCFFAEGLGTEDSPNSIMVCRKCRHFFTQQRSTKQYCSNSCRIMALRHPEVVAEAEETEISRKRKENSGD